MKAIVVTEQAAGTAGMKLVERPEPQAAINDVVVQVHASGFTPGELSWPETWTDRLGRDRTPSIPGHGVAGVGGAPGHGSAGLAGGVAAPRRPAPSARCRATLPSRWLRACRSQA